MPNLIYINITLRRGASTRRASATVGSNFFLKDRKLAVRFKKGGFDALAANPPAASNFRARPTYQNLLRTVDEVRTYFKTNSNNASFNPVILYYLK
ncbi:MAG: hypothetical protein UV73_C0002G0048 [Candidatus Gottesmanbacteria bacterium GW2011_GWA2_43_14]|uniref:Uncharacterized protein n=1 Tax=Candidatus Gottesmanbacteria bacterium GW2011_GWA2_43_14 TaxID=1618443 RepID=A0A0G1DL04_9BACT|nr:MAG: hypothetical protein UV73_C0002G0048 [Candidatus Gottesmanbacteria bacterium GW2011_GWA2_43_14]